MSTPQTERVAPVDQATVTLPLRCTTRYCTPIMYPSTKLILSNDVTVPRGNNQPAQINHP